MKVQSAAHFGLHEHVEPIILLRQKQVSRLLDSLPDLRQLGEATGAA